MELVELEYHKPTVIKHFQRVPRVEPTVTDHSALKLYKECPRKYFYRIVLGYDEKETSIILTWGNALHKFWEILEKTYKVSPVLAPDGAPFKTAVAATREFWAKEAKPAQLGTKYDYMTEANLIYMMKACYDYWVAEKKLNKIKVVDIERGFCLRLPSGMVTSGRIDQILSWNGRLWIRDWKTTSKNRFIFQTMLEPNDQITRYTWALSQLSGEAVQGAMLVAMYRTKNEEADLRDFHTTRNSFQIEVWLEDQASWKQKLDWSRDTDNYPMNETQCGFCKYKKICETPSAGGQESQLKSLFKYNPWNPLRHEE